MNIDFTTTVTVEAQSAPGVTFKIRRLSEMQRAKRDSKIIKQTMRVAEIQHRIHKLGEPFRDENGKAKEDVVLPHDVALELTELNYERTLLNSEHIHPATLRAGLVSVTGITYDGQPATANLLLENGPDNLVFEIVNAIDEHASLTVEQRKNS